MKVYVVHYSFYDVDDNGSKHYVDSMVLGVYRREELAEKAIYKHWNIFEDYTGKWFKGDREFFGSLGNYDYHITLEEEELILKE